MINVTKTFTAINYAMATKTSVALLCMVNPNSNPNYLVTTVIYTHKIFISLDTSHYYKYFYSHKLCHGKKNCSGHLVHEHDLIQLNGIARFKKCKQLFEYQHLLLL